MTDTDRVLAGRRNGLVVRSADVVIAIGGSWGTLSEIALAARTGVPLVRLNGWDLPEGAGIQADDPDDVVRAVVSVLQTPDVDQADRGPRVVDDDGR